MADAQEVALSDEDVFGPASDREVGANLSPLERAIEQIAEDARDSALAVSKATIEEASTRFEKIIKDVKEANAEAVTKAVTDALEKITAGTRVDTSTIREIVGTIKMPDLAGLDTLRDEISRVGKLVEGIHGAISSTVRAAREDIIAAMKTELKVEVKAPDAPKKPTEWQFDIEYDKDDPEKPARITARPKDSAPPRTALEAARKAA